MLSIPVKLIHPLPLASPEDHSFTYRHDSVSMHSVGSPEAEGEPTQLNIEPVFSKESVGHQPASEKKSALSSMIRANPAKHKPSPERHSIAKITVFPDRIARELTEYDWQTAQPIEVCLFVVICFCRKQMTILCKTLS
eukprot:c4013_g1_i1.p2 GENE.c4013_g1_i1~~c4013_g1_i1.p2  ORF type:complete len:138 (+),score=25.16 c4013_g1_i1:179-592(+)